MMKEGYVETNIGQPPRTPIAPSMDSNQLFNLAEQLVTLREEKEKVEDRLKKLNKYIDDVEFKLSDLMALSETQNFTRSGKTFYLTTKTRASAVADNKDALHKALKTQGFGALVYETVNANSLSAFIKEQIVENKDILPAWLDGLVNVYEKTTVGVRRAAKK